MCIAGCVGVVFWREGIFFEVVLASFVERVDVESDSTRLAFGDSRFNGGTYAGDSKVRVDWRILDVLLFETL